MKYATGLCVGKFYPPHKGHEYLINTAHKQCDTLHVVICGKQGQKPKAELRLEWLQEISAAAATTTCIRFSWIEDVYDPDDSQLWADLAVEWLGKAPDAVFTSESYGDPWAKCIGCDHVLVDMSRISVPVSGTMVRASPFEHWDMLSPCVQAYYVKRVVVIGAESTGKTTLCENLALYLSAGELVYEYGREYCEKQDMFGKTWTTQDFQMIANQQAEVECRTARRGSQFMICDTHCWSTAVWHTRFLGFRCPLIEQMAVLQEERYHSSLYLLCAVEGVPFVQDGTRVETVGKCPIAANQTVRQWMHEQLLTHEQEYHSEQLVVLEDTYSHRTLRAIRDVRRFISE
jgi:HTH-type transcriptional repressor of NAD biosynthesis genes